VTSNKRNKEILVISDVCLFHASLLSFCFAKKGRQLIGPDKFYWQWISPHKLVIY